MTDDLCPGSGLIPVPVYGEAALRVPPETLCQGCGREIPVDEDNHIEDHPRARTGRQSDEEAAAELLHQLIAAGYRIDLDPQTGRSTVIAEQQGGRVRHPSPQSDFGAVGMTVSEPRPRSGGNVQPTCSGYTARGGLGRCERAATFSISVPNETPQWACNMHIGQVVKRWAAPPVYAIIRVGAWGDGVTHTGRWVCTTGRRRAHNKDMTTTDANGSPIKVGDSVHFLESDGSADLGCVGRIVYIDFSTLSSRIVEVQWNTGLVESLPATSVVIAG